MTEQVGEENVLLIVEQRLTTAAKSAQELCQLFECLSENDFCSKLSNIAVLNVSQPIQFVPVM